MLLDFRILGKLTGHWTLDLKIHLPNLENHWHT